jgi:hypothetical protein
MNTADSRKKSLPGAAYIEKVQQHYSWHYEIGELYMEYLKGDCVVKKGSLCSYCQQNPWRGPEMERVPRPMPDYSRLPEHHYLPVSTTLTVDENGDWRLPDDFNP